MTKAKKGTVSISIADNRLRLRWSGRDSQGNPKRFSVAFGAVNATNRIAAERLAREIELDIASGNFDFSLRKYKRQLDRVDGVMVVALIDRYIRDQLDPNQSSSLVVCQAENCV